MFARIPLSARTANPISSYLTITSASRLHTMARTATTATATSTRPRRSTQPLKRPASPSTPEPLTTGTPKRSKKIKTESPAIKKEEEEPSPRKPTAIKKEEASPSPRKKPATTPKEKEAALQAKKLTSYASYSSKTSPFPDFPRPTPEECVLAHKILAGLHGERQRPTEIVAPKDTAGCGNSPSVLDALVRTILSQNTSDRNSSRAKKSMDEEYGGSDKWDAIINGGQTRLQKTIESGGLSVVKSKVIINILTQTYEKYGVYSLDHLFDEPDDEECMRQMLSFKGIGPKTASCVLLFCLRRESFAVDTHVHRLAGLLGWRPQGCSREETHGHLDARIPDAEKYALHVLLIAHGKKCEECKAGGRSGGKCELRRAFKKGKKGEVDVKDDVEEIKAEVKEEEGS